MESKITNLILSILVGQHVVDSLCFGNERMISFKFLTEIFLSVLSIVSINIGELSLVDRENYGDSIISIITSKSSTLRAGKELEKVSKLFETEANGDGELKKIRNNLFGGMK